MPPGIFGGWHLEASMAGVEWLRGREGGGEDRKRTVWNKHCIMGCAENLGFCSE